MKPLRLVMQAFGPFAGREDLDFTLLPVDALFLIHGPTGAGKSTILDGICYALYGKTSGGERQPKEMRSHHASDSLLTEVELDFELGAKRYRVRRVPEQLRASAKGAAKLVKVATQAELYEWKADNWDLLTTSHVTEHVQSLLGFEYEQFRQVIMLPQGQFRRMLSAESKDREAVMETLFATEAYKCLQERLRQSARNLQDQDTEAKNKCDTLLRQAGALDTDELQKLLDQTTQELLALGGQEKQGRAEAASAQLALSNAQALAVKFRELDDARASLDVLQVAEARVVVDRHRRDLALLAQSVVAPWTTAHRERNQLQEELSRLASAEARSEQAQRRASSAAIALQAEERREPEREAAVREVTRLEEFGLAAAKLREAKAACASARSQWLGVSSEVTALEGRVNGLGAERQALVEQVEALSPVAARAEALSLEVVQKEQQLKTLGLVAASVSSVQALREDLLRSKAVLDSLCEQQERARQTLTDMETQWRTGQASVLASALVTGSACPVCGSVEHPHPAQGGTRTPTDVQLKRGKEQVSKAEAEVNTARDSLQVVQNKLASAEASLEAHRAALVDCGDAASSTVQSAKGALLALRAERERALSACAVLKQATEMRAACEKQLASAQTALEQARAQAADKAAKLATADAVWNERVEQIPIELREAGALEKALVEAKAVVETLAKRYRQVQEAAQKAQTEQAGAAAELAARKEAVDASQARAEAAQVELVQSLSQVGFSDESAFMAARMKAEAISALSATIQEHERAFAAARERFARAESAVEGLTHPNLDELGVVLASAQGKLDAVLRDKGRLEKTVEEQSRTLATLKAIELQRGSIQNLFKLVGGMAGVANGQNSANLTFQRFVLTALLDDVLRQASLRLRKMTSNRYTLQRFRDVSDKRRAAGLEIEVFDEQTGTARSANTLSGGEGFMASLSLALGLSDVVQAYAGGIQLDTLFIDEGFGSLDSESLERAMRALMDLQQTGRRIGIISHVEELRHQLTHGIQIEHSTGGSRARVGAIAAVKASS